MNSLKFLVTISGPRAAGKTTLLNGIKQRLPDSFVDIVSHTTRDRRVSEVEGKDYYFVSKEDFDKETFIEAVSFNGNHYGISQGEIDKALSSGKTPIVVVDPEGVRALEDYISILNINVNSQGIAERYRLISVYIDEDDEEDLISRLLKRHSLETVEAFKEDTSIQEFSKQIETLCSKTASSIKSLIDTEIYWRDDFQYSIYLQNLGSIDDLVRSAIIEISNEIEQLKQEDDDD